MRFPGQIFDEETGFHYNYHRYYDPRTGRYLKPDPIGLWGGINLYNYVANNPINYIDPYGLDEIGLAGIKIGEKGGVIIKHYGTGDPHSPAHAHVIGGGRETRIGPKGYPLKGEPNLTPKQRDAVKAFQKEIRKELNRLGRAKMRLRNSAKGLRGAGRALGIIGALGPLLDTYEISTECEKHNKSFNEFLRIYIERSYGVKFKIDPLEDII